MNKFFSNIFVDRFGNNKLHEILNSNFFWWGLVIKLVLAAIFASNFLTDFFIPFADYFVTSGFKNPYEYFNGKGQTDMFPYPAFMLYIFSISRIIFGIFIDWSIISPATIFIAKLPIFIADFCILIVLCRLTKNYRKAILYYWLSPILIYINYVHSQLDVIPIAILFISLFLLFKAKLEYSSIVLGLAIASKTSIILVLPFYLIYLFYCRHSNLHRSTLNFLLVIGSFVLINSLYITNLNFIEMVFNNQKQLKILDFSYEFPDKHILYFVPLAYLFLLMLALDLKKFSKDLYMMFLGFSFGIIALMVSPMQGWYYWIMPFFVYFNAKQIGNTNNHSSLLLFALLQGAYFIYFALIKNSDYLEIFQIISPHIAAKANFYHYFSANNISADQIVNLAFTFLQTMLLANCILMYKFGIKSHANYKIFAHPFLLGISGDSGSGKTTLTKALVEIFKQNNTSIIYGDDTHKWERGDKNWEKLTHLNPKSNNLHDEISTLKAIKNGETISRKSYSHNDGKFTKSKKITANNLIISEGLHSFFIKPVRELYDLKIFVNPAEEIRKNWKIARDTKKRGYSKDKVLEQIAHRKKDSDKFIKSQLQYADIVIEILPSNKKKQLSDNTILKFTIDNSFYLEPINNVINEFEQLSCQHEYQTEDKQSLTISGNISSQEIDIISNKLKIDLILEDIGINNPNWSANYIGIIQIILTYCIVKKSYSLINH